MATNNNPYTYSLGSSTITCGGFYVTGTNATFTGTSNIIVNGSATTFSGNGYTFYNVQLTGSGVQVINGANTFSNLTRTGTATKTDGLKLGADQTITSTLALNGNSVANRIVVQSDTIGTARNLICNGTVTTTHAVYQDITGAGAAAPFNFSTSDAGSLGNTTYLTFPVGYIYHWVGNSGNWSDINHWSTTKGGTGGVTVPLPQDLATFDSGSITIASRTITVDEPWIGNVTTTGVLYSPTITSSTTINVYGTLTLGGVTWTTTNGTYLMNRADTYLTSGGTVFGGAGGLYIDAYNQNIGLADALSVTGTLYLTAGGLITFGKPITAAYFDTSTTTYTRTLDLGASTVTLNGTAASFKWNVASTNFTLVNNTSLIYLTNSTSTTQIFVGGGLTNYNNLTIAGAGTYQTTIQGSNTFVYVTVDRSQAAKTVAFTSGTTTTLSALGIATSGTTRVALTNTSSNSIWTLNCTAGVIYADYVDISYCVTTGGALFYSGTNSTIVDGTIANGTGTMTGSPVTLYESKNGATYTNTPTVTVAGTFTATLGSATLHGTATSGGWTVSGSPQTLNAGSNTVTVSAGGSGTINITVTGSGWNPSVPTPPGITTNAASSVGSNTAIGNGNVTSLGAYTLGYVSFQYSLTGAYSGEQSNTTETSVTATGVVSTTISGLTTDTLYHYRAVIRYNDILYVYGSDQTFTMTGKPVVATGTAVGVSNTSATLQGSIVSVGVYPPDYVYFEYSPTGAFSCEQTATAEQTFSIVTGYTANITGLSPNQLYYFRAAVRYVNGTSMYVYATPNTFTTSSLTTPTITTGTAANLTTTGATLQATFTVGAYSSVAVYFEYGTDTSYGTSTTLQMETASGAATADVTNLTANQTYHFRADLVYGSSNTVITGADASFVTSTMSTPAVQTDSVSDIYQTSVTLNGMLDSIGSYQAVAVYFVYGLTSGSMSQKTTMITEIATGAFNESVINLATGTTYYYTAVAEYGNSGATVQGSTLSFNTNPAEKPTQPAAPNGSPITLGKGKTYRDYLGDTIANWLDNTGQSWGTDGQGFGGGLCFVAFLICLIGCSMRGYPVFGLILGYMPLLAGASVKLIDWAFIGVITFLAAVIWVVKTWLEK